MPDTVPLAPVLSVDDDTLAALQARWRESPDLPAIADRAPGAGAAKSPRGQPLTLPYGLLACEFARSQKYSKSLRKDTRKVTLSVWGTYEQAVRALAAMQRQFHSRMGSPPHERLAYPSGARFVGWRATNDGQLKKEEGPAAAKGGEDVWRAWLEAEVTSARAEA